MHFVYTIVNLNTVQCKMAKNTNSHTLYFVKDWYFLIVFFICCKERFKTLQEHQQCLLILVLTCESRDHIETTHYLLKRENTIVCFYNYNINYFKTTPTERNKKNTPLLCKYVIPVIFHLTLIKHEIIQAEYEPHNQLVPDQMLVKLT